MRSNAPPPRLRSVSPGRAFGVPGVEAAAAAAASAAYVVGIPPISQWTSGAGPSCLDSSLRAVGGCCPASLVPTGRIEGAGSPKSAAPLALPLS